MSAKLEPGTYRVEVVLHQTIYITEEDNYSEDDALDECRKNGGMVDWEVEKK
jgi:hypothetical protein